MEIVPKVVRIESILKTNVEFENISYFYVKFHTGIERCDEKFWEVTEDRRGRLLKMENMPKTDSN